MSVAANGKGRITVPLAVLPFDRRLEHDGAMVTGAGERRVHVGDPDPDDVGDPAWLRRAPLAADVGDDHGTLIADGQLGPMGWPVLLPGPADLSAPASSSPFADGDQGPGIRDFVVDILATP
jgi:hypothetical protein